MTTPDLKAIRERAEDAVTFWHGAQQQLGRDVLTLLVEVEQMRAVVEAARNVLKFDTTFTHNILAAALAALPEPNPYGDPFVSNTDEYRKERERGTERSDSSESE